MGSVLSKLVDKNWEILMDMGLCWIAFVKRLSLGLGLEKLCTAAIV